MRKTSDRIFGLATLALAVGYAIYTTAIEESFIQDPLGPKAFPLVIAVVMAAAALVFLLSPDDEPSWPRIRSLFEILACGAAMVVYALLLPEIGFVVTTFLATGFLSWRMGATPKGAVICGVAISILIYVSFRLVLGLSLAQGPWGF